MGKLLGIALTAVVMSLIFGMLLAWLLVNRKFGGRREIGALATAALVLPAPVISYYILWGQPQLALGGFTAAAVLSAAPLLVRAFRTALVGLDARYANTARSLGASDWRIFWRVELPQVWRPVASAVGIAFVRLLAEFAVILWLSAQRLSHD